MKATHMALAGLLALAWGGMPAWGDEAADRTRALEERIRQLEEENRRLREQVAPEPAAQPAGVVTDDVRPEGGWLFQPDARERHENHPEDTWAGSAALPAPDGASPLRDQLYVKDIVSDAGC